MRTVTRRQRGAALVLAAVAVLFCALDLAGAPFAGARHGVQGFLGALYRGTDGALGPTRGFVQDVTRLRANAATIADQRRQIAALRRSDADAAQDAATAAAVDRLQLQATRGGYRVVPARVTAIGPADGFDWTVALDAGSADGLRAGQTVIAGAGLVGRVVRVWSSSATVLLAADPGSSVGVRDERTGEIGLVTGRGTGAFTYAPLDPSARPEVGDALISGPQGSTSYVTGLTVGTITAVHRAGAGALSASVTAAAPASTLDVVGVVLPGGAPAPRPALTPAGSPAGTPASPPAGSGAR